MTPFTQLPGVEGKYWLLDHPYSEGTALEKSVFCRENECLLGFLLLVGPGLSDQVLQPRILLG